MVYSFTQILITVYFTTFDAGLLNGFTKVSRIYSVDLYDTTVDYQDIGISDELIKSQLMWPDMSLRCKGYLIARQPCHPCHVSVNIHVNDILQRVFTEGQVFHHSGQ